MRKHLPAIVTAAVAAALFAATAARQPFGADTAELQTVTYILGIPHPTGFPLFVLLGYAWTHLFAIGTVAWRVNVLCGVAVAVSFAFGVATARRLGVIWWIAVPAYLWCAVTMVIWQHATQAEVHDVLLLFESAIVYGTVVWMQSGDRRVLLATGLLWGLALAVHPNAIWLGFGLAGALLIRRNNVRVADAAIAVLLTAAGLLVYLYLPLRSLWIVAHRADPTWRLAGINGGPFWNTGNPSTLHGFMTVFTGSDFGTGSHIASMLVPANWQDYVWTAFTSIDASFGSFAVVAAIAGAAALFKRDRATMIVVALLCVAAIPFSIAYADVEADVDRYRLLLMWFVPLPIAAAAGFRSLPSFRNAIVGLFVLVSLGATFWSDRSMLDNGNADGERHLISEMAPIVPTGSVVVTPWLDSTPYAYGSYVDASFAGRTIVAAWPGDIAHNFPAWASIEPVYIIVPPGAQPAGGTYLLVQTVDTYHAIYRYVPSAFPGLEGHRGAQRVEPTR